jgi:4'-phosphopantetheinyl transferase
VSGGGVLPRPIAELPPVALTETLSGGAGIVDLWFFFYQQITDPELLAAYAALMTPEEKARHDRYLFERDRNLYLATRALCRSVLSRYAAVDPAHWRFAEGERGKPYIESPKVAPALHFNLTNTLGLVACAVSTVYPQLGIDAENLLRPGETVNIADHYFSPGELRGLRAQPVAAQRERFFCYWTLKESYIKARGHGLALPLAQFCFLLDDGPEIGVTFDPRLFDHAPRWRFALLRGSPSHMVAVGADTGGAALSLRACNYVPLRGPIPFPGTLA